MEVFNSLIKSWRETRLLDAKHPLLDSELKIIYAQNAMDYCENNGWFTDSSHANGCVIAPPFKNFVVEFLVQKVPYTPLMLHFRAIEIEDGGSRYRWLYKVELWGHPNAHGRISPVRGRIAEPFIIWSVPVDDLGYTSDKVTWNINPDFGRLYTQKETALFVQSMIVGIFAISLMNCKNVTIEAVAPHKRDIRMAEKKGKPIYRYHVLKVKNRPMLVGDSKGGKRELSFHIVRGHFKRYTEAKPLLGKHVGQYFWAQSERGSKKIGEVDKDYAV